MTNTVLIKRSGTANSIPTAGNLSAGELAINYNDGNLFYKDTSNVVQLLVSTQFVSVTGNISGGNIAYGSGTVSGTGNILGSNIIATSAISAGSISLSGNVTSNLNVSLGIAAGTTIVAVGNITGGNINAAGLSLSGNVVSNLRVTANISGGNITTAGLISATGNIIVGNVQTVGIISAAGNIIAGNVNGGANVTATTFNGTTAVISANVQGGNLNGNAANIVTTAIINSSADLALTPTVEYLVVAGGGGGGGRTGGGGGGGGLLTGTVSITTPGTLSITVGAGGAGGLGLSTTTGTSGSNSVLSGAGITTVTTVGGGGGGGEGPKSGLNGGSGGGTSINGGSAGVGIYPGSSYISAARQGYDGSVADAGGGGGAGQVGQGDAGGGNGLASSISGASTYYAGGGGGWARSGSEPGGLGGGGAGAVYGGAGPVAGTVNTGGGGGGGDELAYPANINGAAGGSGVVIVRYADTYSAAAGTTGSPTYTVTGGYRIYTFTGTGTITFGGLVNSNSPTTGALIVTGGVGIGQDVFTGGNVSVTGNVNSGNVNTTKVVATSLTGTTASVTGNVTGNYFVGNGSALTGIIASAGAAITNGNSNVSVAASSNVTVAVTGSTIATFASTGAYVTGIISATGNITGGNVSGINLGGSLTTPAQPNITSVGTLSNVSVSGNVDAGNYFTGGIVSAVGNITGGNLTGANIAGTLTTASQTNITSVGTLTALSVTGNVTSGNLTTGGDVSATGNVTAGNILGGANVNATTHTGSTVSVTGNVTGGNLVGGNISGTLITAAQTNITSVGTLTALSVTGNVSGGNLTTGSQVSATGNVTGGNVSTGGNVYTPTNNTGLVGGQTILGQGYVGSFNGAPGSDKYLTLASNAAFSFGTGDFTVECWVYLTTVPIYNATVFRVGTSFYFNFRNSGRLAITNTSTEFADSPSDLTAGSWFHIAAVRQSGTSYVYVNGVAGTGVACSFNFGQSGSFIGGDGDQGDIEGYISNFRVVKGLAVYTGNFTVPTGLLTATAAANPFGGSNTAAITGTATSLLTLQNSTIIDNSTNVFSITNNGTVTTALQSVPFSPGVYAGTFLYDGATWQSTSIAVTGNTSANGNITGGNVSTGGNVYTPTSNTGLVGGVNGTGGLAYVGSFNGSNQYLSAAYSASLNVWVGDFTIEAWVYSSASQNNYAGIISSYGSLIWQLVVVGNIVDIETGGGLFFNNSTSLPIGQWTHIAVSKSGTTVRLFQNGVAVSTITGSSSTYSTTNPVSIGSERSGGIFFNGYISNVRMVKGVGVYTGTFTTPTGPLQSTQSANPYGGANTSAITGTQTSLLTLQNSTIIDNSTFARAITNNGTVTTAQQTVSFGSGTSIGTFLYDGTSTWQSTAISVSGNVSATYLIGNGSQLTGIASTYGNANVAANLAAFGSNPISTTGNITGGYILGNGSQLTGIASSYGNANVAANLAVFGTNPISTSGNITGGNILGGANVNATTHTGATVSVTGNITGGNILGGANVNAVTHTGTTVSVSANISSGNVLTGGNVYTPTTNTGIVGGISGAPYVGYFNGTSYPSVSSTSAFDLVGDFTLEAFVYPTYRSADDWGIVDARVSGASPSSWIFAINNGIIQFYNGSSNLGTGTIPLNTWTHIAVVRSGSALNYYINGVLDTARPSFGTGAISPGTTSALIGSKDNGFGASYSTVGSITNLRIVNGTAVYTGNFTVPTGTLTATASANPFGGSNTAAIAGTVTKLLTLQNSTLIDNSSFGLTITANGVTMSQSSPPPFASAAQGTILYDGSTWQTTPIAVTGNVSATYFVGNGSQLTGIASSYGNANVAANLAAFGSNPISTSGNITAGNIIGTHVGNVTGTTVSVTGNITGGYILGNGSQLTGIASSYGNANVAANLAAFGSNPISTSGNITAGNISGGANVNATTHTGTTVSVSANITAGNLITSGFISATGNITGNNAIFTGNLSVAGNVTYIGSNVVTINDVAINLGNNAANITQVNNGGIELGPQGSPYVTFLYNSSANTFTSNVGLSAVANITGGNLNAAGLSLSGNVVSAVISAANITTTANVSSGNVAVTSNATVTNTLTVFGSSSPLAAPSAVDYLVVGAGGSGFKGKTGTYWGGGGGAGQVLYGSGLAVSAGVAISVTIGAGGADQPNLDTNGYSGNSSVLLGVTAVGGTGGLYNTGYGGTSGNGYTGGAPGGGATAGGGGGAGFTGSGQDGGNGITSSITGSSTYYGGGGSAGRGDSTTTGTPGLGGGGRGSNAVTYSDAVCQGAANTGGGGGGGGGGNNKGAAGGSGLVVIRYPDTYAAAQSTTGTPTYTVAGGYRIYQFTSSGTITWADTNQNSTSTTTGALIVSGGVGIAKDVFTGGLISATGNITGNYFIGNGSQLTGIASTYGNANVAANLAAFGSNPISTSGNITAGNILGGANINATTHTGATVSVTGNITGGNILGGANVNATTHTGATVSVSANITGGNVSTGGNVYTPTNNTGLVGGQTILGQGYVGSFNGTNQYLYVPSSSSAAQYNLASGAGNWTVECWFKATSLTNRGPIVNKGWNENSTNPSYGFWILEGYNQFVYVIGDGGAGGVYTTSPTISTNTWYHAALVRNGNSGLCFLDGTLVATLDLSGVTMGDSGAPLTIGTQSSNTPNDFFPGYISGVRIVKGVAVYTGNFTVPSGPLTATASANPFGGANTAAITGTQTSLLTLQGSTITDTSTYAASITNTNTVTTALQSVPFASGVYAGTFLYDGTIWQSTPISVTGNVTGNYFIGNGSQLTGIVSSYGNANVAANLAAFDSNPISTSGNITAGNILGGANVNATTHTGATVSVTGNITGGNLNATGLSLSGNVVSAVISAANITTTANVTGGYILGNGSQLTGLPASYSDANVVTLLASFGSNTISTTGNVVTGNLQVNGNITYLNSNVVTINDKFINVANNAATAGDANGGGLGVGPVGSEYASLTFNSSQTAWNTNIPLSVTGNITAGNILGGANVNATTHTGATVSVTGNVTGNYFIGNGSQLTGTYGNANVAANLAAFGSNPISTTGSITGGNIITPTIGTGLVGGPLGSAYVANIGSHDVTTAYASQYIFGTSDFTIEFWINPSAPINFCTIFTNGPSVEIDRQSDGSLIVNLSSNGGSWNISDAALSCTTTVGTWNHIAIVRSGSTFKLYKDGISQGTVTSALGLYNPSQTLYFPANASYNGFLSNLRLVIGVAVYTSNFTPPNTVLTATQSANTNGNPSVAITGTQTKLLAFETAVASTDSSSYAASISASGVVMSVQTVPFGVPQGTFIYDGTVWQSSTIAVSGNIAVSGPISATGNVTAAYLTGNGSQLTGIVSSYGNANVAANLAAFGSNPISTTGNITAGNIIGTHVGNVTGTTVSVTGNVTAGNILGGANVNATSLTGGTVSVTGDITGGNLYTAGAISSTGNSFGGNLSTTGQVISTNTGSTTTGAGQMYLNGAVNNRIDFNTNGAGAPAFTTRSTGTKIVLYPNIGVAAADYALGVESGALWSGVPDSTNSFKWYGGTTQVGSLSGTGVLSIIGNVTGANLNATGLSLSGNVVSALNSTANITTTANIAGGYILGDGSQLTGIASTYGNANVAANLAAFGSNPISTSGNITGGNIIGIVAAGANAITTTGNITSGNVNATGLSLSGNVVSALNSTANITTTANITGGNLLTNGNLYTLTTNTGLVGGVTVAGQAYVGSFNGSSQYLSVASNAAFSFGTGDFTLEAWIYLNTAATGTDYRIFTNWGGGGDSYQFYLRAANNRLIWQLYSQNSPDVAALQITPFTWTHVAFCRSGTTIKTFINGALADTTTGVTNSANGTGTPTIGADTGGGNYFPGYISNLRIVKSLAVYTGAFTVPTAPLSATQSANPFGGANTSAITGTATSLLTLQNSTIIDNSTYVFSITNNGTVTTGLQTVPFGSGVYAGTFLYDGTIWQSTPISVTGNVTATYLIGDGSQLTGIVSSYGNANVAANLAAFGSNPISTTGNITAGNIIGTHVGNVTGTTVSVTGNITGGNLNATGLSLSGNVVSALNSTDAITTTANIAGGNILGGANVNAVTHTGTTVSVSGNITGGNVNTNTIVGTGTTIRSTGALNLSATGNIEVNSTYINNLLDPVQNQDAATKYYVDTVAQGLHIHDSANLASTADLATYTGATVTYNNGASGVGATLSLVGNTLTTLDGVSIPAPASTRLLIKNQGNAVQNGMYNYTSSSLLTRSADFDTSSEAAGGDFLFVISGATQADTGWVQTTDNPTLGTSPIVFTQFSGAGTYTANTAAGLVLTGTVFSAKTDNISTTFDGTGNIVVKAGAQLTTPNIGAATGTSVSVTGNITGGNIIGSVDAGANTITTTGNITGGNLLFGSGIISGTGNITGGNVNAAGLSLSSNVVSAINSAANITTTANIAGGNIIGILVGNVTGTTVSVLGNITAGNILGGANVNAVTHTGATVSVTGNIITGGGIVSRVVSIADATSVTINADTTDLATQTNTQVTGTLTINAPTGTLANGQKLMFRLQSSNVQTFSWNAVFAGSTDLSLPTTSSGSSKYDYMGFIYNSTATKWQLLAKNFGF